MEAIYIVYGILPNGVIEHHEFDTTHVLIAQVIAIFFFCYIYIYYIP